MKIKRGRTAGWAGRSELGRSEGRDQTHPVGFSGSNQNVKNRIKIYAACNLATSAPSTRALLFQLLKEIFFFFFKTGDDPFGLCDDSWSELTDVTCHMTSQKVRPSHKSLSFHLVCSFLGAANLSLASLPSPHTETGKPFSKSNSPDGSA